MSGVDVDVRRETGDLHGLGSELWGKSARGQVGNMGWLERSEEFGDYAWQILSASQKCPGCGHLASKPLSGQDDAGGLP